MITLTKSPDKDFIILNLTDMQMNPPDWDANSPTGQSVVHTISTLIERVKPDLITITGDIADGYGEYDNDDPYTSKYDSVYENLVSFMDSFKIPWAPISGNHDHFFRCVSYFEESEYCLFRLGEENLGRGNYVIGIRSGDDGDIIHALILMDTHANFSCQRVFGGEMNAWCNLWPAQLDWYNSVISELEACGCRNSSIFIHIPIYAFRLAKNAALKDGIDAEKVTVGESYGTSCWNDGYENSFGVWHEGICAPDGEDGVLDKIIERHHTTHIIAGHDHVNNAAVNYRGINLIYGMKTGFTTYFEENMNGGTVLKVTSDGITDVWHEYVK